MGTGQSQFLINFELSGLIHQSMTCVIRFTSFLEKKCGFYLGSRSLSLKKRQIDLDHDFS